MFKIYNGKGEFFQWDLNQKLLIGCDAEQMHFIMEGSTDEPLCTEVYIDELTGKRVADVPNILLQNAGRLIAYSYFYNADDNSEYTYCKAIFAVNERPMPPGYVYTETERMTWANVLHDATEAKEAAEKAQAIAEEKAADAADSEAHAKQSEENAALSEQAAEGHATDSGNSASAAALSAAAAKDSEDKAKQSEQAAEISRQAAEAAVGKTSYIGNNGNWYEWNADSSAFVDTGIPATGPIGPAGADGNNIRCIEFNTPGVTATTYARWQDYDECIANKIPHTYPHVSNVADFKVGDACFHFGTVTDKDNAHVVVFGYVMSLFPETGQIKYMPTGWLCALNGTNGVDGVDGADGQSAYEAAQIGGYTGTQEQFYADLGGQGSGGTGLPDGGVAGDMLVKQSDREGDAVWQKVTATDQEVLTMLNDLDLLPAVTSDGAILTDGGKTILLF